MAAPPIASVIAGYAVNQPKNDTTEYPSLVGKKKRRKKKKDLAKIVPQNSNKEEAYEPTNPTDGFN